MNAKKVKAIRRAVRQRYVGMPMCEYNHSLGWRLPLAGYRIPQIKLTDNCLRKQIKRAKQEINHE